MESNIKIPDSLKSVSVDTISECFRNCSSHKQNRKVKNPKSIYGKVATQLTHRTDSTFEERNYLLHVWKNCNKVIKQNVLKNRINIRKLILNKLKIC